MEKTVPKEGNSRTSSGLPDSNDSLILTRLLPSSDDSDNFSQLLWDPSPNQNRDNDQPDYSLTKTV
jgi:hypothetical protein